MKLIYKGKYNGDEATLPARNHPEGYTPYKEPENMKKFAILINVLSVFILLPLVWLGYLRIENDLSRFYLGGINTLLWGYAGLLASLLVAVPHELLHAICFKDEVWLFRNLKQGMLFVVGIEDMSRARFIFMSMLPNLVFGFIPYLIFMLDPDLIFFGTLGAFSVSAGAGDYLNVINTLLQVPKGALVYMSGMHTYWYIPKNR